MEIQSQKVIYLGSPEKIIGMLMVTSPKFQQLLKQNSLKIASSEEDSKSHDSDNEHSRTAGPSTSLLKLQAESISEEEEETVLKQENTAVGKYSIGGSRKNAPFLKKQALQ